MKLSTLDAPTSLRFLSVVTSFLGALFQVTMIDAEAQRHDIRHSHHNRHYPPKHRFQDFDYEDATVVHKPEFLNTKSNITVRMGESATLPCSVRHLGTKEVVWRRIYSGIKEPDMLTVGTFTWAKGTDVQVEQKLVEGFIEEWNLYMRHVKKTDEGTYECQVTEKVPIRTFVYLHVKPPRALKPAVKLTGEQFVDSNDMIKLKCNATGGRKIPEEIDWFKDGTKLDSSNTRDPNIVLTKYMSIEDSALISELTIEHAGESDSGNYICRSSDKEIASLKVTVLVAPDNSNVKRGTGAHTREENTLKGSASMTSSVIAVTMLSFLVAEIISWTTRSSS